MQNTTAGTADGTAPSPGKISQAGEAYAASRGISRATLEQLRAVSGTVWFRDLDRKAEAVVFPYFVGGERVYWKARAIETKAFSSQAGGKVAFFNLDRVLTAAPETVFITEGEFDAAALVECGISADQVLSVPSGAPEKPTPDNEPLTGYAYALDALKAGLSRAKRFVWCGDGDDAGLALRMNMARILGVARFWFVEWPEGIKDPNAMLEADGPDALREIVTAGAQPWPVSGLYRMSELPDRPPLTTWSPGFPEWESKVLLAPGAMSVVTGHPGHGKTQLFTQIWFNIARRYGIGVALASFETLPKPHGRRNLRTLFSGKLEKDMSDEEKRRADAFINERYWWLFHEDQRPTLQWLLDRAEVAVVRHGVKALQIDPWNRLESRRDHGQSETEYIGECLTACYVFAQQMDCHVQIVAHPAKLDGPRKGQAPMLEDIAGSKHWDNRVDHGFIVHRPKLFDGGQRCTGAELHHRKVRFPELGYDCRLELEYVVAEGRYRSSDYDTKYGAAA